MTKRLTLYTKNRNSYYLGQVTQLEFQNLVAAAAKVGGWLFNTDEPKFPSESKDLIFIPTENIDSILWRK